MGTHNFLFRLILWTLLATVAKANTLDSNVCDRKVPTEEILSNEHPAIETEDSIARSGKVNVDPIDYTLLHVAILSRHSIRAPTRCDNRILKESQFPLGLGYSTKLGNIFSLKVGKIWREFYACFLENITVRQILARSSSYVRCIETQQLVLSQMFPPKGDFDCGHSIQPIAVIRLPIGNDVVVNTCGAPAPTSLSYLNNLTDPALTHDGFSNFGEFADYLTSNSGYEANGTDYYENVVDAIYSARYNQLPIPEWARSKWSSMDFAMRKLSFDYWINEIPYYGNYIGKFLADRLRGFAQGKYKEKFSFFSYHDTTIQAVLKAMGNDPIELYPSFLGALHFQLYRKDSDGEFYVRTIFHQGATKELDYRKAKELVLAKCPFPNCSLDKFVGKMSTIYDDVDRTNCPRVDLDALL